MDATGLSDLISRGLGTAARAVGPQTDAYRPSGARNPLAPTNRYMRMPAAFGPPDARFRRPEAYGAALWDGVFDSAYTRPGDYLVQGSSIWFIAAQQSLLPPLCVKANRLVSFARPPAQAAAGVNAYGGVVPLDAVPLLTGWPASVLGASGGGSDSAGLPSDTSVPYWVVLLPAWPGVVLRPADLMSDELGRNAVVSAAELTELGWRLAVKQAIT